MCWLIPRLSAFRAAYPEIDTQIVYARHGEKPDFGTAHVAFTFCATPPRLPDVETKLFLLGDCLPVCRQDLLDQLEHAPTSIEDYLKLGLLHDTDRAGWSA